MRDAVTRRALLLLPLAVLAGVTGLAVHASPAAAAPAVPALQATVVLPADAQPAAATPALGRSSSGAAVWHLQRHLGLRGTGHFDATTERAVRRWQGAHGVRVTGVVSGATWVALRPDRG